VDRSTNQDDPPQRSGSVSDSYGRPQITRGEERDLVVAAEAGDEAACRQLVETFLPAIAGIARTYGGSGIGRQELVQEGVAGLLFATRRYDASLSTPFWAYASFWVRKAMQELVAELTRPVALSDRAVRDLAQIRKVQAAHLQAHGCEPTHEELSRSTGLTPGQLESLLAAQRTPLGLEEPLGGEEAMTATVGETIVDPAAAQEYERALDRIEIRHMRDLTEQLDERERVVVRAHYGLDQPAQTLSQIGTALGVTAERVRQIEAGALKSLRAALSMPVLTTDEAA
jgi:RNA polymerase sigma factor (sigma-70 family)